MKYFKLPDLGEGLQEAEIVQWHVQVGDTVKADQLLVSVETAKALVDIPAPYDGIVAKTFGAAGDILHPAVLEPAGGSADGVATMQRDGTDRRLGADPEERAGAGQPAGAPGGLSKDRALSKDRGRLRRGARRPSRCECHAPC